MENTELQIEVVTSETAAIGESMGEWNGVSMHRAYIEGENRIEVIAGTNAPMGGNHQHGARTVVLLHDVEGTHFESVKVLCGSADDSRPCGVVLVLGGDSEARTFADALDFAAKTIRSQLRFNHAGAC